MGFSNPAPYCFCLQGYILLLRYVLKQFYCSFTIYWLLFIA
nr:MAG TPA: hypothetical protein [Caudoviricetes sp.]